MATKMRVRIIKLHRTTSRNVDSVASDLGQVQHSQLDLTMTAEDYLAQTSHAFSSPHNPGYYPPTMVTAQKQTLKT